MSPLEEVETTWLRLVAHYAGGEHREVRAAAKLLIVALAKFREHGGADWPAQVDEYVALARDNPDKLERILQGHSSTKAM